MSGGPIHSGMGDTITVARVRPEAACYASRHLGKDMSDIFITAKPAPRPATAPPGAPRPLPGFESVVVGVRAPRVKPEAADIARRSRGSMSQVLAQDAPRLQIQLGERPKTAPQKPINGPIGQEAVQEAPGVPRVKPEASKTAELGQTGLVGRLFANSMDDARRANIENSLKSPPREKNHIQKNIQRMRRIQREAREKQQVLFRTSSLKLSTRN